MSHEQNLTLAEKSELEREFKYKRMKTMHEINMRLLNENAALKAAAVRTDTSG